jgi:hypothetical protein
MIRFSATKLINPLQYKNPWSKATDQGGSYKVSLLFFEKGATICFFQSPSILVRLLRE